jgi:adenylate cyclase
MALADNDAERDELRDWLRAHGATEAQLSEARHEYELVADLALARDVKLSARDIAARLDDSPEAIIDAFRVYGVLVPDADAVLFSEADASFIAVEKVATPVPDAGELGEGRVLARVVANALDRVAEACVAYYVQGKEDELRQSGAGLVTLAETTTGVIESAEQLGHGMSLLFRHHLRQAVERQRVSQVRTRRDLARVAVGFVDLVGSTALEESLDPADLRALVSQFEARAFDVAAAHGGRVVKFIGDEIMVVALDPIAACRMMLDLLRECGVGDVRPRGGLSYGEVLFRGGDYYGSEVNLAARLVEEAIPGEVLVGKSVVDAVTVEGVGVAEHGDGGSSREADSARLPAFEPAGRRLLKGFTDPVPVWSVSLPVS